MLKYKIREQIVSLFLLLALTGWIGLALGASRESRLTVGAPPRGRDAPLIIDAGHGGVDGGAVTKNGTVESHINLAIALRMDAVLRLFGVNATLLRSEDVSLHDPACDTIREQKVSDLRNRVSMIESVSGVTVISIHQNTFPDPRYSGAQVFYREAEGSLPLAALVRENLKSQINPENNRELKQVPETVYIMKKITCPAIIVECGFLSNPMEETALRSAAYQTKLATVLAGSWLQYSEVPMIEKEGETPGAAIQS